MSLLTQHDLHTLCRDKQIRIGTASIELAMFMPILIILLVSFLYFGVWGGAAIRVRSMARLEFSKRATSYQSSSALLIDEIANPQDILTVDGEKNVLGIGIFPARSSHGEFTAMADCWNYRSVPLDEFLNPKALKAIAGNKSFLIGNFLSLFELDFSQNDREVKDKQSGIEVEGKQLEASERENAKKLEQEELDKRRLNVEQAQADLEDRQADITIITNKLKDDGKTIPADLSEKIGQYRKLREDSKTNKTTISQQRKLLEEIEKVDPELRSPVERLGAAAEKLKNNQFAEEQLQKQIKDNPL